MKRPFFAVLGGMGTLATESYVRLLDKQTHARSDQEYLDYVVFNDASVPDRTAYILGNSTENPVPAIIDDIHKATVIGASFIVLACNTEHYFFDEFQASTTVPILHMPRGAVRAMSESYPAVHVEDTLDDAGESIVRHARVGFMGTEGSRVAGVYSREITAAEYEYIEPDAALQQRIDSLIYDDVKGGRPLNRDRYESVVNTLLDPDGIYRCDIVLLGCTELSVLNEAFPRPDLPIIDAQAVLVEDTIKRARALRSSDIQRINNAITINFNHSSHEQASDSSQPSPHQSAS